MMLSREFVVPQNHRWSIHAVDSGKYIVNNALLGDTPELDSLELAVQALIYQHVIWDEEADEVIKQAELFFRSMEVEQE